MFARAGRLVNSALSRKLQRAGPVLIATIMNVLAPPPAGSLGIDCFWTWHASAAAAHTELTLLGAWWLDGVVAPDEVDSA